MTGSIKFQCFINNPSYTELFSVAFLIDTMSVFNTKNILHIIKRYQNNDYILYKLNDTVFFSFLLLSELNKKALSQPLTLS